MTKVPAAETTILALLLGVAIVTSQGIATTCDVYDRCCSERRWTLFEKPLPRRHDPSTPQTLRHLLEGLDGPHRLANQTADRRPYRDEDESML